MLTINDLKNKMIVMVEGVPYQVLEVKHQHIGRGGSSVQTRLKNILTGQVYSRNFKPADTFGEADVEKRELTFLYGRRGEYVFVNPKNKSERYNVNEEKLGDSAQWLKPNTPIAAVFLEDKLVSITPPIKVDLLVTEAATGLRGDTVSGATKEVVLETGAKIQVPLFVNEGDVIRVNTETGEYAERMEKGK